MKAVDIYRYIKGYVNISVKGGFTERFINLCAARSVQLFKNTYVNGGLICEVDTKSFGKLRRIARKTGVRISVNSKKGLVFFVREKKYRAGLIFGAAFYCLFLVTMNIFVWNIDAGGSEKFSSEQLIEAAQSVGVKYGISRFFFDESKAAREIYKYFNNELSWVTVNIIASKCYIEVRDSDEVKKDTPEKNKIPSNLVADFDGVILSDETYCGIKSITKGNAVKKGDLLISGVMEDDYGAPIYYTADGNFTARHNRYFESVSDDKEYFILSAADETTVLHVFGLNIKTGATINKPKEYIRTEYLSFNNNKLPFGYSIAIGADEADAVLSENQKLILTADLYTLETYNELRNTKILSDKTEIITHLESCTVKGEYDCIDYIGISKPIVVENIESK